MLELTLCIVACSLLVIGFKVFHVLKIPAFQAIVINYGVAGGVGFLTVPETYQAASFAFTPWLINASILGFVFIFNFYILALSTQKLGASVTSVASKMSLVITILFGILYFHDVVTWVKFVGIILAFCSIFLITRINSKELDKKFLFLPLILFIGGGFIDIFLNYNLKIHFPEGGVELFSTYLFSSAFVLGLIWILPAIIKGKERLKLKTIAGGGVLGLVNWYSIFFLMATLKNSGLDSSTVYTLVNIGIVVLSVLSGVIIFKERLSSRQWLGISFAIAAITIISIRW